MAPKRRSLPRLVYHCGLCGHQIRSTIHLSERSLWPRPDGLFYAVEVTRTSFTVDNMRYFRVNFKLFCPRCSRESWFLLEIAPQRVPQPNPVIPVTEISD